MGFYRRGHQERDFERGIQVALQRILASPKFVFRAERDSWNTVPGKAYRISDLELASRLSFFLWSSIPDDELLQVASEGKLGVPAVLEWQVRRMLADPKSKRLVANFAGQWLTCEIYRIISQIRWSSPISTTICGSPSGARAKCSSKASFAKTATSLT